MDMNAKDVELQLWRSGLVSEGTSAVLVERTTIEVAKHARKHDKARLQACNGIERWDASLGRVMASLTEEDQAKIDATIENAEQAIEKALKAVLKRGVIYDFRRDPRGAILRFVNKANTKDGWIY